jgi:hypothetical protein
MDKRSTIDRRKLVQAIQSILYYIKKLQNVYPDMSIEETVAKVPAVAMTSETLGHTEIFELYEMFSMVNIISAIKTNKKKDRYSIKKIIKQLEEEK